MKLFTKLLRTQVALVSKVSNRFSVEKLRSTQEKLGELMAHRYRLEVKCTKVLSTEFAAEYIVPPKKWN